MPMHPLWTITFPLAAAVAACSPQPTDDQQTSPAPAPASPAPASPAPASPGAPASPIDPTMSPTPSPSWKPTYPVTSNLGRPPAADDLALVQLVDEWVHAYEGRDYRQPFPGYPSDRLQAISTGEALARARAIVSPAPADYEAAARMGYTRSVKITSAFLNPGNVTVNIATVDIHTVTSETSYEVTTGPCGTAPRCVATATTLDTE